jgi:hypothetical protein
MFIVKNSIIDKKIHTYHNVVENHLLKEKYSHLIKEFLEKYK